MPHFARLLLCCAAVACAHAEPAVFLDTVLTLGKEPDAVELPFTIPADRNYRVTITDLGPSLGPPRLIRADVGVARGSSLVASVSLVAATASGVATKDFAASAGAHRLIVIGQPASLVGSLGVRIEDAATGTTVLETVQSFTVPGPPSASPAIFEHELSVPAGTFTLETTDFAVPAALGAIQTTVIRQNGGATIVDVPNPAQVQVTGPDVYELFVYAELASNVPRGLVGVNLRDTQTGAKVFAEVHKLGEWPFEYPLTLSTATSLTVALNDVQFPLALAGLSAAVVRDGLPATPRLVAAPAATSTFAAGAGDYAIYVAATPAANGAGSFGLRATDNATSAMPVDVVQNVVVPGPLTDVKDIDTSFDVQTAGDYTLTLTDFGLTGFFDAFDSISLALTRDGQIVKTLPGPGNFTFSAIPGRYSLAILADPSGASGEGLLGVRVRGGPADAIVYDDTAAVGSGFVSATFDVTNEVDAEAVLTDLLFPARFAAIKVAVTRGSERVGEILGEGRVPFHATPGKYFVNLLATPDATIGYSTMGLKVSVVPPPPTVMLTATATNVQAGGLTTLTWSSTDASSCTASGGWSGARQTIGSSEVGPLNANTKFTLSCTGPGGAADASVDIAVTAQRRSGGGGGLDWITVSMLALALLAARSARRAAPAGRPR